MAASKKYWRIFVPVVLIIFVSTSLIEISFFHKDSYFIPNSMITVAKRALACSDKIPQPTLALIEENKINTCVLVMNASNMKQLYTEIKEFINLEVLYLASNRLSSLPSELSELPLKHLDIGKNQFLTMPKPILALQNLEKLEAGFNRIRTVPRDIGKLKTLTFLSLNKNLIIRLPSTIGDLTQLEFLEMGDNRIIVLPDAIGRLSRLAELYLYDNKLTEIPPSVGQLTNLKILDLRNNQLQKLPSQIAGLKSLERLDLSGNGFDTREIARIRRMLPNTHVTF